MNCFCYIMIVLFLFFDQPVQSAENTSVVMPLDRTVVSRRHSVAPRLFSLVYGYAYGTLASRFFPADLTSVIVDYLYFPVARPSSNGFRKCCELCLWLGYHAEITMCSCSVACVCILFTGAFLGCMFVVGCEMPGLFA